MKSNFIEELHKERTAKELFNFIEWNWLEKIAVILLILMCVFPILGHFLIYGVDYTKLNFTINVIGRIGVIFGIFVLIWLGMNEKRIKFKLAVDTGLPFFLALMFIWSFLSCIFSTNVFKSFYGDSYRLEGFLTYISYAGIFTLACSIKEGKNCRKILEVFTAVASVMSLICFIDNTKLSLFFSILFIEKGIFSNVNHFGYYLCMAIPAVIGLFVTDKIEDRKLTVIRLIEIIFLTVSLIKAKSMGPLIAVATSLVLMGVLTVSVDRARIKRVIVAVFIVILTGAISSKDTWNITSDFQKTVMDAGILKDAALNNNDNKENEGVQSENNDELYNIGSKRGILWVNAIKFIKEKPLFGYGPDNLGDVYHLAGADNDRPHNEFLQFAASLGLPAAIFYVCAMASLLVMFIKRFKFMTIEVLCIYCIIGSYLVSSMFGNTMFYTSPFYFMVLGLSYSQVKQLKNINFRGRKN